MSILPIMIIYAFYLTSTYLRIISAFMYGESKRSVIKKLAKENLLLKRQIQILKRKSGNRVIMTAWDRLFFAFNLSFGDTVGLARRCSVLFNPETLLKLHKNFIRMKYRKLYTPSVGKKRGPKGKSDNLVKLVCDIKKNNPDYGSEKIAGLLTTRGHNISDSTVRRILRKHYHPPYKGNGPSWLEFFANSVNGLWSVDVFRCESVFLKSCYVMVAIDIYSRKIIGFSIEKSTHTGTGICRMLAAICGKAEREPKRISTDHDPLFKFHRWKANLRIMEVEEIKTVPYVPCSHPFVERVIGTIRREFLDKLLFFGINDLEKKLEDFKIYYNEGRVHSSLIFLTPEEKALNVQQEAILLENITWKSHCKGMYKVPIAA
jgi:putative transposase